LSNPVEYTATELQALEETAADLANALAGKMCILGRADTGTTDIGVNPSTGSMSMWEPTRWYWIRCCPNPLFPLPGAYRIRGSFRCS
jgi:hypothetical protein